MISPSSSNTLFKGSLITLLLMIFGMVILAALAVPFVAAARVLRERLSLV